MAFRNKGRQFCPSCHARRLAAWSLWLQERLLAPVAHRQVVLTVPKRLRAYFLYDRRRLSLLSRVTYRTLRDYLRVALGECEAAPGAIVAIQSFGALVHWHPHLRVLMTDGAFRHEGTFLPAPPHAPAVLEEAWRRRCGGASPGVDGARTLGRRAGNQAGARWQTGVASPPRARGGGARADPARSRASLRRSEPCSARSCSRWSESSSSPSSES